MLESFLNKVAGLRLQHRCFPVKFAEVFKNIYFEEHLRTTASCKKGLINPKSYAHEDYSCPVASVLAVLLSMSYGN